MAVRAKYTWLTAQAGPQRGGNFLLDPGQMARIGRGSECSIVVDDALCSRVHAEVYFAEGVWQVRDAASRNGTFVNGQRTEHAVLAAEHCVRLGSSEFCLHEGPELPRTWVGEDGQLSQSLVRDTRVELLGGGGQSPAQIMAAPADAEQGQELLALFQLCSWFLAGDDPWQTVHKALELIRDRTSASHSGYLAAGPGGGLTLKVLVPPAADVRLSLSEPVTRLVCDEGHAVWIANQRPAAVGDGLEHDSDALCVPLMRGKQSLGALFVYLERARFRQSQFDFVISVANVTAQALARSRERQLLRSHWDLAEGAAFWPRLARFDPAIHTLVESILAVDPPPRCVLIRGESGTGILEAGRSWHERGPRAAGPLALLRPGVSGGIDAQFLAGTARVSAVVDRLTHERLRALDQGTLLIDECAELDAEQQLVLWEHCQGFGSTAGLPPADVRIAATSRYDLAERCAAGLFRTDLAKWLQATEFRPKALRERPADIGPLADLWLAELAKEFKRPNLRLSAAARADLETAAWPGNLRQLQLALELAAWTSQDDEIQNLDPSPLAPQSHGSLRIDEWERKLVESALARAAGNIPLAAEYLGLGRATLYRRLEEYGLRRAQNTD